MALRAELCFLEKLKLKYLVSQKRRITHQVIVALLLSFNGCYKRYCADVSQLKYLLQQSGMLVQILALELVL
jgi:putative effector of murein hydrolase